VVAIAVSAVLSHSQSLLMDRGLPRAEAAALVGLFGIAISLGRLVSGYLLDVFRGPTVAFFMFALPASACVLLLLAGDNRMLCGAAIVLVGLAGGAEHDIAAFFTAKYFGRAHYSAIYGLLYALYGLGGGFGPLFAGAVYDSTGSYDIALYGGIAVFLAAATMIGTLRAPVRRARGPLTA
jgi:predicted MFS family arabinose efflux permease